MAKSLTIALLAIAFAGLAVMAAPSSSEEVALVSREITEVQPPAKEGTPPSEQEGVPDNDEESKPTDELEEKDKELEEEGEELEEEDEEMNTAKAEVCAPIPLIVLSDIKERLNLGREEAEEYMVRLFSLLNRINPEEAPADFNCMMHLMIGTAALHDMQKVLSLYADYGDDDIIMELEGIMRLKSIMKNALDNEGLVTENSDNTKEARIYVSLGLDGATTRTIQTERTSRRSTYTK